MGAASARPWLRAGLSAGLSAWLAVLVALLGLPACSYAFVQEAPVAHRRLRHFDCTSSRIPPVLDTAGASLLALSAGARAISPESGDDAQDTFLVVGTSVVLSAVFVFSAAYGYVHTAECEEAQRLMLQRLAAETPAAVTAPAAPGTPAATIGPAVGCASDMDCKGARICVEHACVNSAPGPTNPNPGQIPNPNPNPNPNSNPSPNPNPNPSQIPSPTPPPSETPAPAQ